MLGGVASWSDNLIRASPDLRFHLVAIGISTQKRQNSFTLPNNIVGITNVLLDVCPTGRPPAPRDFARMSEIFSLLEGALTNGQEVSFRKLIRHLRTSELGEAALLNSRQAWTAMEHAYERLLPNGPLLDFFWSWRFLLRSLLSVATAPLPHARVFHAVATGFSGLIASCAKVQADIPFLLTEHGIYTNERRIELAVADWLYDSGAGGYITTEPIELRSVWLNAFQSFSRIAYACADLITTQYRANQSLQLADGAPPEKLSIIPNGIDTGKFGALPRGASPRRPTVLMIGRIVPIKDIRTFIMAVAILKDIVPDVLAILIGPEDEDPEYAEGCRELVRQLDVSSSLTFLGRVPDIARYLVEADVLALSSISEAQPIAMLEAAAMGLPVVSTDVGSCREIIEGFCDDPTSGRGGFVVEPCNSKAMADALAAILLDESLRTSMADVMRRRVGSYYEGGRVTSLYENVYSALAARSKRNEAQA